MARVLVLGSRDEMPAAIDALYELKLLHIVDHQEGEHELGLGAPLPKAGEASEVLLKVRAIAQILQVEEQPLAATAPPVPEDVNERIRALELRISEEDANKRKIEGLLDELSRKVDELTPFVGLPVRLEDYRGYESLEVLAGRVKEPIAGLETVTTDFEAFAAEDALVVFVQKEKAPAVREYLAARGFAPLTIPEGKGDPKEVFESLQADRVRWQKRLGEVDGRLTDLRDKFADLLLGAQDHLAMQVEKAEAPLRFAVTDHAFVAEGWVPQESLPKIREAVGSFPSVAVEVLEEAHSEHHEDPDEEPPVLLKRTKVLRPIDMLTRLFGLPSYHEIDPSFVVSMSFGMMFGIMVGDAGYGIVWIVYGAWLLHRWRNRRWDFWKNLVVALIWGGFWAFIFGAFVFAEAFGIPFHMPPNPPTPAAAFNWSDNVLGLSIPIHPMMEKLTQVADFMELSICIAALHLGTGLVFGILDEWPHSRKHGAAKLGWFLVLLSFFTIILARTSRWPGVSKDVWGGIMFWFPKAGLTNLGGFDLSALGFAAANPLPYASLASLVVGFGLVLATEAGNAMEIIGLLSNIISYARLAGIGVAEEAVIFALNGLALNYAIFPGIASGNVGMIIAGSAGVAGANVFVFILSALSGTIQSVRLNYVEFFLKFYKGTGRAFRPFGEKVVQEV